MVRGSQIQFVSNDESKPAVVATLTLNNNGECKLRVGDDELDQRRFRRVALEDYSWDPGRATLLQLVAGLIISGWAEDTGLIVYPNKPGLNKRGKDCLRHSHDCAFTRNSSDSVHFWAGFYSGEPSAARIRFFHRTQELGCPQVLFETLRNGKQPLTYGSPKAGSKTDIQILPAKSQLRHKAITQQSALRMAHLKS